MGELVTILLEPYELAQITKTVTDFRRDLQNYRSWVGAEPNLPLQTRALAEIDGEIDRYRALETKLFEAGKGRF